jgi:hypothetical protein
MGTSNFAIEDSLSAGASIAQYRVVKLSGSANTVIQSTGDTDKHLGICQNAPATGQAAQILTHGRAKAEAGAAITLGDILSADGTGRVVTIGAGTALKYCIGQALEAATAAGDIISVQVTPAPFNAGIT